MIDRDVTELLTRLRSVAGADGVETGMPLAQRHAPPEGRTGGGVDALIDEVVSAFEGLGAEVGALADELLERYEEITLLHELARDLVAVFDEEAVCRTVVAHALQAVPAATAMTLLQDTGGELAMSCRSGDEVDERTLALAYDVARRACGNGVMALVHEGEDWHGEPAVTSVLAVPLLTSQSRQSLGALVILGRARARFTAGDASLASTMAQQLARAVESDRLIASLREKERIEREMELAGAVQRQLLPRAAPELAGISLAAACLPAEHVGGDYYDFVACDGGITALVADVSGHGIGPGLMMAMTRAVLRRELQQAVSLSEALKATNAVMWDDLTATGLFITVFCVRYDTSTGTVQYVNGGHHPALLRRASGVAERMDGDGWPLGLTRDPEFDEPVLTLEPGDAVLVFSDGIVEERSPSGQMYGTERLTSLISSTTGPLVEPLLAAVHRWRDGGLQQDDVTLLELRTDEETHR